MAQFLEIKAANPDCMLFYRMGDFYELFFEDAVAAAEALGIVLTKRGKHLGEDIPMCGVPIHRADEYLQRLITKGFRVAVCEQMEDPAEARKRGSKAVVHRDVVRLVTPGTLTEESLLDAKARNYLTAVFKGPHGSGKATVALASLDISTGEFEVGEIPAVDFPGEIVRLSPGEVMATDSFLADADLRKWIEIAGAAATPVPAAHFDSLAGERQLKAQLGVADLAAFGAFSRPELAAVGALLKYVELTQIGKKPCLRPPRRSGPSAHLVIDAPTRSSLELLRSTSGDKSSSLLAAIDRTVTGPGARELAARLASPLRDPAVIGDRLDAVGFLHGNETLREDVRRALRHTPDLARALSRLALQRGTPKDLGAIRDGLAAAQSCARLLRSGGDGIGLPTALAGICARLAGCAADLQPLLARALVDDPPHLRRDGNFVRPGFSKDLDDTRALRDQSRQGDGGAGSPVPAGNRHQGAESPAQQHSRLLHRGAGRCFQADAEPTAQRHFPPPPDHGRGHALHHAGADRNRKPYRLGCRPSARDRTGNFCRARRCHRSRGTDAGGDRSSAGRARLSDGAGRGRRGAGLCPTRSRRHHHVRHSRRPPSRSRASLEERPSAGAFIENDCVLVASRPETPTGFDEMTEARLWLVTGPNMAGKSTFLRQNALITVLAQMGSFVPARSAHIGIVDRLFSRVGAADDLARGRSTFMVEMVETAGILNQATSRSLVILDEIGRGTATFDGLSIAWAVVEHLHEINACRALFATHYHELTALAGRLPQIANVTMDVREWRDEIVFLHKVKTGAADRSYGIQVAKLAGLPKPVTRRAAEVLALLEKSDGKAGDRAALLNELPLFAAARPKSHIPAKSGPSPAEEALAAINPDELTPKAALEMLYKLKDLARKERP